MMVGKSKAVQIDPESYDLHGCNHLVVTRQDMERARGCIHIFYAFSTLAEAEREAERMAGSAQFQDRPVWVFSIVSEKRAQVVINTTKKGN